MTMAVAGTLYHAPIPIWMATALGEYGVAEIPGPKSNPKIAEYLRTTQIPAEGQNDETPWCAAFVGWCLVQSGFPSTGSAAARSYLAYGKRITQPTMGAITVLWRESPASGKGHVAFFVRRDGTNVWLLGGNQQNGVCVERYPAARILDFRGP